MIKANIPNNTAREPEEEAHQPWGQNKPPASNRGRKSGNIYFAGNEKPDSQSSSSYKEVLSQPPPCISHRHRMLWLQQRRSVGLYVQCDACNRWRYLPHVLDRYELPETWNCNMNPDSTLASCSIPEVPIRIHEEEDLIHNEYNAGSLVVARVAGWPWWPAMVVDCPDAEQYYWLDGFSDIPTFYHVVFFDEEVSRAWVRASRLKPYTEGKNLLNTNIKNKLIRKRLEMAITQAKDAEKLGQKDRLAEYSLLARYQGKIGTPKKITRKEIEKYQKVFKRKFSVDFPIESDDEIENNDLDVKKKRLVSRGGKKLKKDVKVKSMGDQSLKKKTGANKKKNIEKSIIESDQDKNVTLRSKNPVDNVKVGPAASEPDTDSAGNPSLLVQVDTNSDSVQATFNNDMDTSTTHVPDTTVTNTEKAGDDASERPFSPGSGDFDF